MVVFGLVIVAIGRVATVYQMERQEAEIDGAYDSVRSALNGFITAQTGPSTLRSRYPCPARLDIGPGDSRFGMEQRNADGTCIASTDGSNGIFEIQDGSGNPIAYIGAVPTNNLRITSDMMLDNYGNKMTYAISANHVVDNALVSGPDGQIEIEDEAGNTFMAPFALVSHGRDGAGAYSLEGGEVMPCQNAATADGENCDFADNVFRSSRAKLASTTEFYDDRMAFSLVDEEDDEWWEPFPDSPQDLHNKNPGIVCIGADCDFSDADSEDDLVVNGGSKLLGGITNDLNVIGFVSSSGDIISGRDVAAIRDVLAQGDVSALNDLIAQNNANIGGDINVENNANITGDLNVENNTLLSGFVAIGDNPPATGALRIDGLARIDNGGLDIDSDGDNNWRSLYNSPTAEGLVLSGKNVETAREDLVIAENGKVGIGTSDPKTSLDVNGEIKIANENAPCNASREGAIRYNAVDKVFEGCDGVSYKPVTGRSCDTAANAELSDYLVCNSSITKDHAMLTQGSCGMADGTTFKYGGATGTCMMQCNNGEWEVVLNDCSCEPGYVWVNATSYEETPQQACSRKGYIVAEDQGYGTCASGERRPVAGMGEEVEKISYKYGTWGGTGQAGDVVGYSGWDSTATGSGQTRHYCYSPGQKRDGDSTDLAVAYLCKENVVCEAPYTGYLWVNASSYTQTHKEVCKGAGYKKPKPSSNPGYGMCASGEHRPTAGEKHSKIAYKYGTWGDSDTAQGVVVVSPEYAQEPGCVPDRGSPCPRVATGRNLHYCYANGQKRDSDGTDLVTAYLCLAE